MSLFGDRGQWHRRPAAGRRRIRRGAAGVMDETGVRAAVAHYFEHSAAGEEDVAHEIYLDDAVLEFPQSGERFDGVANFKEWRRQYPAAKVDFDVRRVRGAGDVW